MNFNQLCINFNRTRPHGAPIGEEYFVDIEWSNGSSSSNDLLRKYLHENNYNYLNSDGTVWFIFRGHWTRCKVRSDRNKIGEPTIAHFMRCIFKEENE